MPDERQTHDVLRDYKRRVPQRPYVSDDLRDGVWQTKKWPGLRLRYVQANGVMIWCLIFDCDHDAAFTAAEDGILPPPNLVAMNPDNGRGHLTYLLDAPVPRTDAARVGPLRYLAMIERGMTRRLDADIGFAGLITKNPLHAEWRTVVRHDYRFTLRDLDDYLHPANCVMPRRGDMSGLGRNCLLFDELRHQAYRMVREFKRNDEPKRNFDQWAIFKATELNAAFATPMHLSEVLSIARSVARWVWSRFDDDTFRAIQSHRGKRGAAKRWAGHVPLSVSQPWKTAGISRATFYRRTRRGRSTK